MKLFSLVFSCLFTFLSFSKKDPEISLKEIDLFSKTVKIKIPAEFKTLGDSKIKQTYQGLPTIKLVYTNDDATVRIAFGSDDLLADDRVLPKMTNMMKDWLKGRLAKNKWKGEGVKIVGGNKFGYLEYILKKPEKYYEHMFFVLYRGQMLSCSIHSPKKGYKFWKGIAEQMMESLVLKEKD